MNISVNKREGSPDFVIGSFGFKYEDLKPYVNDKGYVNCDILQGKRNGIYIKVSEYGVKVGNEEEIPF